MVTNDGQMIGIDKGQQGANNDWLTKGNDGGGQFFSI
jgi:hypothetical protein